MAPRERRGFADSDFLPVIAVVALLLGALLPALQHARKYDWSNGWPLNLFRVLGWAALDLFVMIAALAVTAIAFDWTARWFRRRRSR